MKGINILNLVLMALGLFYWAYTSEIAALIASLFAYISMLAGEITDIKRLIQNDRTKR